MSTRGVVPDNIADLQLWLPNFAAKLGVHATALLVTPAEVASVQADAAVVDWTLKTIAQSRAWGQHLTAFKDAVFDGQPGATPHPIPAAPAIPPAPAAVLDGILPRTRQLVQRIKTSPGYNEAIGKDLGIVVTQAADTATPKPTFRATALPHHEVRLDWVKGRHSGVLIQSKRNDDKDWVTLGTDNYSPYVDGRDLVTPGASETRQYRMRYLDKDDQVGEWSDIVSAVASP